jgi:hypothetical protein
MSVDTYIALTGLVIALVSLVIACYTAYITFRTFKEARLKITTGLIQKHSFEHAPVGTDPNLVTITFDMEFVVENPASRGNSLVEAQLVYECEGQRHAAKSRTARPTSVCNLLYSPLNINAGSAIVVSCSAVLSPPRTREAWGSAPPKNARLELTDIHRNTVSKSLPKVPELISKLATSSPELSRPVAF